MKKDDIFLILGGAVILYMLYKNNPNGANNPNINAPLGSPAFNQFLTNTQALVSQLGQTADQVTGLTNQIQTQQSSLDQINAANTAYFDANPQLANPFLDASTIYTDQSTPGQSAQVVPNTNPASSNYLSSQDFIDMAHSGGY